MRVGAVGAAGSSRSLSPFEMGWDLSVLGGCERQILTSRSNRSIIMPSDQGVSS